MGIGTRFAITAMLLVASGVAAASNFSGTATVLIGLPAHIVFNGVLGAFLFMPISRARNAIATVILVPLLILGGPLSFDALSTFDRPSGGWVLSVVYFGLVALTLLLYFKLINRRQAEPFASHQLSPHYHQR